MYFVYFAGKTVRLPPSRLFDILAINFRTIIFANSRIHRDYVSSLSHVPLSHACFFHLMGQPAHRVSSTFNVQIEHSPLDDLKPPATTGGTDCVVRSSTEESTTEQTKGTKHFACFVHFVGEEKINHGGTERHGIRGESPRCMSPYSRAGY